MYGRKRLSAEEGKHLLAHGGDGEPELLVKHLVGSRCAEVVETEYLSVRTDHRTKRGGQTGGETEDRHAGNKNRPAVFEGLVVEQTYRGN